MSASIPLLESTCPSLKLLARGKVRDLYDIDETSLLFVATDRISAYDCIMKTGIHGKGKILTQLSAFWFTQILPHLSQNNHHLITTDLSLMPESVQEYKDQLEGRVMLVKKCVVLPVEAIVRGYITGSAMAEYKQKGTVCDIPLPTGLVESGKLDTPLFTPSTKAAIGDHDENIHPSKLSTLMTPAQAREMESWALALYEGARAYAAGKGIIIADTKFEFGVDGQGRMVLVDEVLTPDSSRFWPLESYTPGQPQPSFDKQYLRDYLTSIGFDKSAKEGIELPQSVVDKTLEKYIQVFTILTGKAPVL